ncbi:MAG TPA: phage holin family protein [Vicinamibacterales bacterium]|nr:phage holin family protein [Vicinamibacterales bacterium]
MHESEKSTTQLMRGALDDVRELFREEVALARAEIRQELSKASTAAMAYGAGGAALWFCAMFLLAAIAIGISSAMNWSPWIGFAIVGVLLGIAGGVMLMIARGVARDVRPLPRTINSVKENLQ